nr:ribonuclease H-like domain-containing protein [Tanacetum cinerariifolium]
MVTRFCDRTNRLTRSLNLHVSSVSSLPKSYCDAFNDLNWQNAMWDEYNELIKNNTWRLVLRPTDTNIVRCMWLFHHKCLADGTLGRYKARLVAIGSTQIEGIIVDETFSLVCLYTHDLREPQFSALKRILRYVCEKMSRDVITVGSTMRIPLLYRGEYSQWRERFMNYLEAQTDGEAMINSIQNGDQPLPVIAQVSLARNA